MRASIWDELLLGSTLAAALASSAWFGWLGHESGRPHPPSGSRARMSTARYVPAKDEPARREAGHWFQPRAQSRGPGWNYEIFTPPEIFYDGETKQFAVALPGKAVESAEEAETAPIELVAVIPELFPLQLVGYVGGAGHCLGSFETTATGAMFLAGARRLVPELNLEITDFAVQRTDEPAAGGTGAAHMVATAMVRDLRSGRVTRLASDERTYTGELLAMVATEEDDEETLHELCQGQELQVAGETCTIDRLQREPPVAEITVTRAAPVAPRQMTLTPRMSRAPPAASPLD